MSIRSKCKWDERLADLVRLREAQQIAERRGRSGCGRLNHLRCDRDLGLGAETRPSKVATGLGAVTRPPSRLEGSIGGGNVPDGISTFSSEAALGSKESSKAGYERPGRSRHSARCYSLFLPRLWSTTYRARARRNALGEDHPDVGVSYNSMTNVYNKQSKYDLALEYLALDLSTCCVLCFYAVPCVSCDASVLYI